MRRWTSTIGALLLVLMLWTGGTADAALPASDHHVAEAATADSHRGDRPAPNEHESSDFHHHHLGDSGHQLAALSDFRALPARPPGGRSVFGRQSDWLAGDGPALTLRPPIA